MYVIDVEITQRWVFGSTWWMQLGGGLRYAHVNQTYSLSVADAVNGNSSSNASDGFTGYGPTVSFEFHRRVWDTDFGSLGLYSTLRGSLLFTTSHDNYSVVSSNALVTPISASGGSNTLVPIGEAELGGEWIYCWGRFKFSGQLGVTGQFWGGGGNASQGANLNNPGNQSNAPANFGFIGGVGRVGVSF